MRSLEGRDKAMLVFAIILFILAICNLSITGVLSGNTDLSSYIFTIHFAVGAWTLVNAIVAFAAALTGNAGAYIAVIVLTILGTLAALGGISVAIVGYVSGALIDIYKFNCKDRYGYYRSDCAYYEYTNISGLPVGLIVLDALSFVVLIVTSSIACCGGSCCGSRPAVGSAGWNPQGGMVVVQSTQSGYAQQPPGYMAYPSNQPGYYNNGMEGSNSYPPMQPGGVPMQSYQQKA